MSKINVVEIIGDMSISGAPNHLLTLVRGIKKDKDFNFMVICPNGPLVDDLEKIDDIDVEIVPFRGNFDFQTVKKIRSLLKKKRLECLKKNEKLLVHVHGTRAGWLGRLATIRLWLPVIYTEHLWTFDYHLKNRLLEYPQLFGLWFMDFFTNQNIAVSGAVADFLSAKISRPEKVSLIYNGIEIPKIKVQKDHKEIIIGSVGGLNFQKNYELLLRGVKILKNNEIKNWRVEIIGDGQEEEKLKKLIKYYKLQKYVKIEPGEKDLTRELKKYSIYTQTSRSESFGQVLAQAMSIEIVPIVTAAGAMPEIVGRAGLVVEKNNPKALAKAFEILIKDKEKRHKLGREASHRIKKYFQVEKMIFATKKLYTQITQN